MEFPFKIKELDQTASTQTYIIDKDAQKPLGEYTVIYTTNQTAGRGQDTHTWESEKGKNISFSLLLKPDCIEPSEQFIISKFISLAIVDTLVKYGLQDVSIKWPNDIYVKHNKICGFLVQNKIIGNKIAACYIGIGINVNQVKFLTAPNPTSVLSEIGRETDLKQFLNDVLQNIYVRYRQVKDGKIQEIDEEYHSLILFFNHFRKYIYQGKEIIAKIIGVDKYGHAKLEKDPCILLTSELRDLQYVFD